MKFACEALVIIGSEARNGFIEVSKKMLDIGLNFDYIGNI